MTLRPFAATDLDDLYAYHRDPEVARYLYWEPRDRGQSREALDARIGQYLLEKQGNSLILAVVWRETGRVAGEVNLEWLSEEHRQGEVGFVLNPEYQGRGVATEAGEAMLRLGFEGLGLHRIIARCDARNHASAAVMRRLGMRQEAHFVHNEIFKGEWGEELVFAMLADEWERRRGSAATPS
nr:GNAT family N-acetyltransferase [Phytoactinopolyspora alkaliphila]